MNHFKKLSCAVWQCKYLVVWCPKYRFRILKREIGKSIRAVIRQLCDWRRIEIVEGSVQIDHINLMLSIAPKYSVSQVIGFLKGKSALRIFDMNQELKRRHWGRHFWAKGSCVSTIGLDEQQIRKYVRWQLHRDRKADQMNLWK